MIYKYVKRQSLLYVALVYCNLSTNKLINQRYFFTHYMKYLIYMTLISFSLNFWQVFELCFSNHENVAAIRRCTSKTDWTITKKFCCNPNIFSSADERQTNYSKNCQGKYIYWMFIKWEYWSHSEYCLIWRSPKCITYKIQVKYQLVTNLEEEDHFLSYMR